MKTIDQFFHMVLFIMLYKVVLIFKSVDKVIPLVTPNSKFLLFPLGRQPKKWFICETCDGHHI